ncbi:MAG: hypothetical protein R6W77_12915 [Trueperaceae bacterium]
MQVTFPGDAQPTEVNAELYDGMVLIECDIALGALAELSGAQAPTAQSRGVPSGAWPATTATPPYVYEVPYVMSDDFSQDCVDDSDGMTGSVTIQIAVVWPPS